VKSSVKHKIVILGCGNLAWHLAKRLNVFRKYTLFVYNHQANSALKDFKSELNCITEVGLDNIISDAYFYFICVSDSAIASVSSKIKCERYGSIIVHTSGSAPLKEINGNYVNAGVFYPLQTFSKKDNLSWGDIPIIIEVANEFTRKKLFSLAKHFSKKVLVLSYEERLKMHLSAVLVNNFTNSLYVAAADFLNGLNGSKSFELLLPLIRQTTKKIEYLSPLDAQTGPAKRNDRAVLNKHVKLLSEKKELRSVYRQVSKLILKQQEQTCLILNSD
jgi:predicted short-subunit dehydrogenase-like oxidoreductase (DUF2520 family)